MKKICIICEGNYPYVVGGVSTWVNQIIKGNPEYEFSVMALIPNEEFASLKYELPANLVELKNHVLNKTEYLVEESLNIKFEKSIDEKQRIKKILNFGNFESNEILDAIDFFSKEKNKKHELVILKENFWEAILENYNENGFEKGLNQYYWTNRNLFLNLTSLGNIELPKADLYHSTSTGYAGVLIALINYRNQGKTIITEHGIYSREREEEIISSLWIDRKFKREWINFFNMMSKIGYENCDELTTLFRNNMEYEISHGALVNKTKIISNGINIEKFEKVEKYSKEEFSIGSVLRIVPIKDIIMMIRGFKLVLSKIKDAHLYLIGPTEEDPEYYTECLELVEELELGEYVTFTGKKEAEEYYRFLDLFLLTSVSEGQPFVILEALACGIPCIATDVGDCKGILEDRTDIGRAGIIIEPTNYQELADEVVKLYNDQEKRLEMSKNGIEIVRKYYTEDICQKKFKEIYKNLLKGE